MKRYDIINQLIKKNNYKSFLEIGTQESITGNEIQIHEKYGVDPKPIKDVYQYTKFYQMLSDDFFKDNKETFDIIFIDGDHSYKQSKMDFINAWKVLNKGGVIVLHDSLPHNKEYSSMLWNGEVFKTIKDITNWKLNYYIVDTDHGCTVVKKSNHKLIEPRTKEIYTYEMYVEDKKKWNIITPEDFMLAMTTPDFL